MPVLSNPRHERFAQELAKGNNGRESYLAAGYDCTPEAADVGASKLLRHAKVSARLKEIQSRAADRVAFTAADMARQLDDDREFARSVKQAGAVVSASMGKAKVLGLITDKHEHTGADGGPIETADLSARELIERRTAGLAARNSAQGGSGKPH